MYTFILNRMEEDIQMHGLAEMMKQIILPLKNLLAN